MSTVLLPARRYQDANRGSSSMRVPSRLQKEPQSKRGGGVTRYAGKVSANRGPHREPIRAAWLFFPEHAISRPGGEPCGSCKAQPRVFTHAEPRGGTRSRLASTYRSSICLTAAGRASRNCSGRSSFSPEFEFHRSVSRHSFVRTSLHQIARSRSDRLPPQRRARYSKRRGR
jgi:hypothetical protein